jgi:hypothetical protein
MEIFRLTLLAAFLICAGWALAPGLSARATARENAGVCVGTDYSSDVICTASLVGYWRMNDVDGSVLVDSSPRKNNAEKTAGVTLQSTPLVAGAMATSASFDGISGYATLDLAGEAHFHNWSHDQAWTVEAMVRPDLARAGTAEEYAIFSKMQSVSPFAGFEVQLLYQSSVGKARVRVLLVNTLDEHRIDVVGSSDVTNGANHHIAVGYDGSGTAAGITIHVDGVLDEKIVRSDRLSIHSIENPAVPTIGARDAGAANLFKGNIQELAIYGGAAQTTEGLARSNVYSAGKPYYRWGLAQGRSPLATIVRPNLILDTDLSSDIDDVGDLALAMGLHLRGEANLIGVIISSANDRSADAAYAIAKYMNSSTVPGFVGAWQGSTPSGAPSNSRYTSGISAIFGTGRGRAAYADSTARYRKLLNAQPDGSVVIVATGFFAALNALLGSTANYNGDGLATGASIVSAKVARLVIVAGCYPSDANCSPGNSPEFNLANGPAADAANVVANWPGEIVAVGVELGGVPLPNLLAGPADAAPSTSNPVQQSFHYWGATPRPAWGMLGVLFAVRDVDSGIEIAGLRGSLTVNSSTGANIWSNTFGNRSWTRLSAATSAFGNLFNSVYASLPKPF